MKVVVVFITIAAVVDALPMGLGDGGGEPKDIRHLRSDIKNAEHKVEHVIEDFRSDLHGAHKNIERDGYAALKAIDPVRMDVEGRNKDGKALHKDLSFSTMNHAFKEIGKTGLSIMTSGKKHGKGIEALESKGKKNPKGAWVQREEVRLAHLEGAFKEMNSDINGAEKTHLSQHSGGSWHTRKKVEVPSTPAGAGGKAPHGMLGQAGED